MNAPIRLTVAAMVLVSLAGCGGNDDEKQAAAATTTTRALHTITGTLVLIGTEDEDYLTAGQYCFGYQGYDDITDSAQVTVTNEAGTVIGTTQLGQGLAGKGECRFTFQVPNVPVAKFYSVEVSHRGKVTSSHAEMEASQWSVAMTLG
jgi:hypothetical protein